MAFASPPSGAPEVEAPSPFGLADPATWLPAVGVSTVVFFLGQPASSAALANKQAIDTIFFIEYPIRMLRERLNRPCTL
jgi:hypothetical protein